MTSRREKRWTGGENRSVTVEQLDRLRQKRDVSTANQSHLARVLARYFFLILTNTALGSDGQGPKGFSFVFSIFLDFCLRFQILLLTSREHVWASWSVRRGRASSCE